MSKETHYFTHDYNARNDSKIKKLISIHGYTGYGLFWAIIEDLYNNTNVLRLDYESISFDLRSTPPTIESIINDFELFIIEGDNFGSLSVQKRLDDRALKSKKAVESIRKRWENKGKNTNVLQTNNDSNTIKERKGKERKGKESKVFTPPTLDEVKNYFKENGYSENSGSTAFFYYASANWVDSKGNKIKNWKQKMIGVWFKDESKIVDRSQPKMVY